MMDGTVQGRFHSLLEPKPAIRNQNQPILELWPALLVVVRYRFRLVYIEIFLLVLEAM